MIEKNQFPDYCILKFDEWFENFNHQLYDACDNVSKDHVTLCKKILTEKTWDSEEENNIAYITGTLFKGLEEFVELAKQTRDGKWHLDHARTEIVWRIMWNCIERFDFCKLYFDAEDFRWMVNILKELRDDFAVHFGPGLYSSPEILIKKETCSICNKDTRACMHIAGNLYNGEMCYTVPQEMVLHSVSLVKIPRDYRCRLWPWGMDEDHTFSSLIMVFFQIDDWLRDEF